MFFQNEEEHFRELLSFMQANYYSLSYIQKFKTVIKKILTDPNQTKWESYRDIYLEYANNHYSQQYLRHIRTIIGTLEQFDLYGEYPDGRRRNSLFARGSYHLLSHEYQGLIDFYCKVEEERGLTSIHEPVIPKKVLRTYIPHSFNEQELANFFCECDRLGMHPRNEPVLTRKLTVPVFFRLLYSSGIRTTEVRLLRKTDVDMEHGILDIRYSKGRNQHYIVLHDSMIELMRQYDVAIEKIHPDRTYFFPARNDSFHKRSWVQKNFHDIWYGVNKAHATAYELRHHYAIENINRWAGLGVDFNDKLLYLSKSMGHTTIESTKYYYSIVPGLEQILNEKTGTGFDWIVPEVKDDEINE